MNAKGVEENTHKERWTNCSDKGSEKKCTDRQGNENSGKTGTIITHNDPDFTVGKRR